MIVGESAAIRNAVAMAERYAPTRMPVLIIGATGTGKELFAQYIHAQSARQGELIDVNCGALPREMIESLMFGHRRGSFTGAATDTSGLVVDSDRGTLFLDELHCLATEAQVKLLRVLETGEVRRLGDRLKRRVDLRVVAAVQEDVEARLDEGELRHDLYHRIAGVVIRLPSLHERAEDIPLLAARFAADQGQVLEPGSTQLLTNYPWPGNVRELRLAIERAGHLVANGTLPPSAIAEAIDQVSRHAAPERAVVERLPQEQSIARERMLATCIECDWNYQRIATTLKMGKSSVYRRLTRLGISLRDRGAPC